MDESLILERLDKLSEEIKSLKSDVLEELKQDLAPVTKQATPHVMNFLSDVEGQYSNEDLEQLAKNVILNLQELNSMINIIHAGMELKDDAMPVIQQVLPKATKFMAELDGQFDSEELIALTRKVLSNLEHFNSALDMMKAGMELKDEMMPVIQQVFPKVVSFMNELEQRGVFRIIHRLLDSIGDFRCSEDQLGMICQAVEEIDLGKPSYVGAFEIVNEIRDPNVQETLGLAFKLMRVVGCCLRANRLRQVAEDYPEQMAMSKSSV